MGNGVDLNSGPEELQGISLPQRAHCGQEHGHQECADNTMNIGGVASSELGELNRQEVDDVDFDLGLEATQGINLPRRTHHRQEHGGSERAVPGSYTPTLQGAHA